MARTPAYRRLKIDERRNQILSAGIAVFAEHAYEEISMRQIALAAGVSKPLLYHYFPSKNALFRAAVADRSAELERAVTPSGNGTAVEQLVASLDAYLTWVEQNSRAWMKLMASAASLPTAGDQIETFRSRTQTLVLGGLTGGAEPAPALRAAVRGWLGFMDAVLLDWADHGDLTREQVRDLLMANFGAALLGAQQVDPSITLEFG